MIWNENFRLNKIIALSRVPVRGNLFIRLHFTTYCGEHQNKHSQRQQNWNAQGDLKMNQLHTIVTTDVERTTKKTLCSKYDRNNWVVKLLHCYIVRRNNAGVTRILIIKCPNLFSTITREIKDKNGQEGDEHAWCHEVNYALNKKNTCSNDITLF